MDPLNWHPAVPPLDSLLRRSLSGAWAALGGGGGWKGGSGGSGELVAAMLPAAPPPPPGLMPSLPSEGVEAAEAAALARAWRLSGGGGGGGGVAAGPPPPPPPPPPAALLGWGSGGSGGDAAPAHPRPFLPSSSSGELEGGGGDLGGVLGRPPPPSSSLPYPPPRAGRGRPRKGLGGGAPAAAAPPSKPRRRPSSSPCKKMGVSAPKTPRKRPANAAAAAAGAAAAGGGGPGACWVPTPPPSPAKPQRKAGANPAKSPVPTSSQYRGVSLHRLTKRWEASMWLNGKQVYLGGFETEKEAASAYDIGALACKGPARAKPNFPPATYASELAALAGQDDDAVVAHVRRRSPAFARGRSRFRGVSGAPGRWEARIGALRGRKNVALGIFETQADAARAYDRALLAGRGRTAKTNFPVADYDAEVRAADAAGAAGAVAKQGWVAGVAAAAAVTRPPPPAAMGGGPSLAELRAGLLRREK